MNKRMGENLDIVITGANGQLGKEIERRLGQFHTVVSLSKNDLDISEKEEVYKKLPNLSRKSLFMLPHILPWINVKQTVERLLK